MQSRVASTNMPSTAVRQLASICVVPKKLELTHWPSIKLHARFAESQSADDAGQEDIARFWRLLTYHKPHIGWPA